MNYDSSHKTPFSALLLTPTGKSETATRTPFFKPTSTLFVEVSPAEYLSPPATPGFENGPKKRDL